MSEVLGFKVLSSFSLLLKGGYFLLNIAGLVTACLPATVSRHISLRGRVMRQ